MKDKKHNKAWVSNRPLAFQFQHLCFPMAAVPPLERSLINIITINLKFMSVRTQIYALASLLVLTGCGNKENSIALDSVDLTEYLDPLQVGHKRYYSVEVTKKDAPIQRGRALYVIEGKDTFNGNEYYKQIITPSGIPNVPTIIQYERETAAGRFVIHGDDSSRTEHLQQPIPFGIGDTWSTRPSTGDEVTYRADGLEAQVIFGNTYEKCLKISYASGKSKGHTYYAHGIGAVKIHHDIDGTILDFTLEDDKQSEPQR